MNNTNFKVTDEMLSRAQAYSDKLKADPLGEMKKILEESEVAVKNYKDAILPVLDLPNCTGRMLMTQEIQETGMEANQVRLPVMVFLNHPGFKKRFGGDPKYVAIRKRFNELNAVYDSIMSRVAALNGHTYTPSTYH